MIRLAKSIRGSRPQVTAVRMAGRVTTAKVSRILDDIANGEPHPVVARGAVVGSISIESTRRADLRSAPHDITLMRCGRNRLRFGIAKVPDVFLEHMKPPSRRSSHPVEPADSRPQAYRPSGLLIA